MLNTSLVKMLAAFTYRFSIKPHFLTNTYFQVQVDPSWAYMWVFQGPENLWSGLNDFEKLTIMDSPGIVVIWWR